MATRVFDCETCGAQGKIVFKESDDFKLRDLVYCPFCGGDISEEDTYGDEED